MMNDIDALFNRIQTINAKDPSDLEAKDIDDLVAFYRHRRSRKSEFSARGATTLDAVMPSPAPKLTSGFNRRGL